MWTRHRGKRKVVATDRCESVFSSAIFLHLPSGCSNADPVLSAQEASATRRPAEAFLSFFTVKKNRSRLKSSPANLTLEQWLKVKVRSIKGGSELSHSTRIFGTGNQTSAQFQPRRPWWWRTRLSAGRWPSTGMRHKVKSVILRWRNLQRAAATLFPLYLLRLTVGFAAVVHEARAVALERRVNDLRRHNKELRDFSPTHQPGILFGQWHIWDELTSLFLRAMK